MRPIFIEVHHSTAKANINVNICCNCFYMTLSIGSVLPPHWQPIVQMREHTGPCPSFTFLPSLSPDGQAKHAQ